MLRTEVYRGLNYYSFPVLFIAYNALGNKKYDIEEERSNVLQWQERRQRKHLMSACIEVRKASESGWNRET